jgi:hypothetical protein
MKKFITFICVIAIFASCKEKEEVIVQSATATEEKVEYAYTIEHPDNWVTGSKQNTKVALQTLKDWENGKVEASAASFGDSVELRFNNFETKTTRDSIIKILAQERNNYKAVMIEMNDFESVKSKDGTEEYVSLWYKQKFQNAEGKWDSISLMDDLKFKDGKIISLDEKTRIFAKKP